MKDIPISNFFAIAVVAVFVLLLVLETWRPLRRRQRDRRRRLPVNFSLTSLAFVTGALTVRPAALCQACRWERRFPVTRR